MANKKTVKQKTLEFYKKNKNKKRIPQKVKITKDNFELLCGDGIKILTEHLLNKQEDVREYTDSDNSVMVVSDGSSLPGFGDVGPEVILPTLESKSLVLKYLAGINAVPITVKTNDAYEIANIIKELSFSLSAVFLNNLSDQKSFEIKKILKDKINIPVISDEVDAFPVVVLAGLINAHKVVKKNIKNSRIAIVGDGDEAIGITKILIDFGVGDVILVDRDGIVGSWRTNINGEKEIISNITNKENRTGGLLEAIAGADVVIGVSSPNLFIGEYIRMMAQRPIVFALAKNEPEISVEDATKSGASVVATSLFKYPNHINSNLAHPGIFRGVAKNKIKFVTDDMLISSAKALAGLVKKPTQKKILPTLFNKSVSKIFEQTIL